MNFMKQLRAEAGKRQPQVKHNEQYDKALIKRYRAGDEEAGLELFRSYIDVISAVYRFPSKPPYNSQEQRKLRYTQLTYDDKEELMQEIAVQFFQLVKEFDEEIAVFEALVVSKLHQRTFNNFFSEFLEIRNTEVKIPDRVELPAKVKSIFLEEKDANGLPQAYKNLYKAFNKLSKRERQVLSMTAVNGWSRTEIATEVGMSPDNVSHARTSARRKMKKILREMD